MTLLAISHLRQSQEADCLAACAQIILQDLQIPIPYDRLLKVLETEQAGSYFSKLKKLEFELRMTVELAQGSDDLDRLYGYLNQALPIIAFVSTAELKSYWATATFHAVVVVGLDDEIIYVNDPYFADAPKEVPRGEFTLAWLEQDYWYAVIRLAAP
ncbi:MAG: cysteine peptidase family C39 domain-containing protein [Caldilineaceae bacterium]